MCSLPINLFTNQEKNLVHLKSTETFSFTKPLSDLSGEIVFTLVHWSVLVRMFKFQQFLHVYVRVHICLLLSFELSCLLSRSGLYYSYIFQVTYGCKTYFYAMYNVMKIFFKYSSLWYLYLSYFVMFYHLYQKSNFCTHSNI